MASVPIISRGAFSDAIITSPFFALPINSGLKPFGSLKAISLSSKSITTL